MNRTNLEALNRGQLVELALGLAREVAELRAKLLRDVFGVRISQGGLVNLLRAAAAPVAAQAALLRERLL